MEISNMHQKILKSFSYLYLFLPILIFFVGWIKPLISIPLCLVICFCIFRMIKKQNDIWMPAFNKEIFFQLLPIIVILILWVYFSGIGGFVFQNKDHWWRNETFNLLVQEDWPVIVKMNMKGTMQPRALIYYIGFWLPSAVVGKLFGLNAGYAFQALWAVLGLFIIYYLISERLGSFSIKSLLCLIFFSGLDIIGCFLLQINLSDFEHFLHIEWWSGFEFSSNTTQLFWVFNQSIYAWLLTLLILRQKDNRHLIFFWSCGLRECTLPFVGMLPFLVYKILDNTFHSDITISTSKCKFSLLKFNHLFSIENILGGGCIGIVSFLYEIGNISANNHSSEVTWTKGYLMLYILFLLLEVGLYAFVIYQYQKENLLYWISLITLAICPILHVGSGQDFCLKASIPALFVLMLLLMDTWKIAHRQHNHRIVIAITLLLLCGSITPCGEFIRTFRNTNILYHSNQTIMAQPVSIDEIMCYPNFSGNADESFFFKYIAK